MTVLVRGSKKTIKVKDIDIIMRRGVGNKTELNK